MTVKELIDQLSTLPPDAPVVLKMGRTGQFNGHEATDVELRKCWRKNWSGEWVDYDWCEPDLEWESDVLCDVEIVNLT